jgi:hypothetical protein
MAVALVARLWICFASRLPWYNTDSYDYLRMADAILAGKPVSYFPNGYPLLIAGTKWLVGDLHLATSLIIFNIAASMAVVAMSFQIAKRLACSSAAVAATILVAIWPNQLNYVRQLMTEVPATFFLMLGVLLVLKGRSFSGGISLALAILIRTTLLPVIPLIVLLAVTEGWRRAGGIITGALVVAGLNGVLVHTGVVAPSNNGGVNLLFSIQSTSTEGIVFSTESFTAAERSKPLATYIHFAIDRPKQFLWQRLSSLWELWGPLPASAEGSRSLIRRLLIGMRFPLFAIATLGIVIHRTSRPHLLLAVPILVVTLIHTAFFSTARFSYPVEPLVLILAANAIFSLIFGKSASADTESSQVVMTDN